MNDQMSASVSTTVTTLGILVVLVVRVEDDAVSDTGLHDDGPGMVPMLSGDLLDRGEGPERVVPAQPIDLNRNEGSSVPPG
jgi:hypothetical protein